MVGEHADNGGAEENHAHGQGPDPGWTRGGGEERKRRETDTELRYDHHIRMFAQNNINNK